MKMYLLAVLLSSSKIPKQWLLLQGSSAEKSYFHGDAIGFETLR